MTDTHGTCTFRAHSWVVRVAAAGTAIVILLPVLRSSRVGSGRASGVLIAFLVGLGLLIPIALLVWDHRRGVHVGEDGIRSVGANKSRFLAWSDIATFEIADYVAGMIAVFAICRDETRVALSDTARWPYQRQAVEHIRDELAGYRERWIAQAGPVAKSP
jgi:hypothetical protein